MVLAPTHTGAHSGGYWAEPQYSPFLPGYPNPHTGLHGFSTVLHPSKGNDTRPGL